MLAPNQETNPLPRFNGATDVAEVSPSPNMSVQLYLATLATGSQRTMREALTVVARFLAGDPTAAAETFRWDLLRYPHTTLVRAELARRYAPSTANKMLAAVRGVLRVAFSLGVLHPTDYARVVSVRAVRGSSVSRGRALDASEIAALLRGCDDGKASGARDAAALTLLYLGGMRRAEVAGVRVSDLDEDAGHVRVSGKGRKERLVYLPAEGWDLLRAWIVHRGESEGALLRPVRKSGVVVDGRISAQSVFMILRRVASRANVNAFTPHDLRRTFCGDLLDRGVDLVTVQKMLGHGSITTTARYDRRSDAAMKRAARGLHLAAT